MLSTFQGTNQQEMFSDTTILGPVKVIPFVYIFWLYGQQLGLNFNPNCLVGLFSIPDVEAPAVELLNNADDLLNELNLSPFLWQSLMVGR